MKKEELNMDEKYYIGLDIGTSSLGWVVTDRNYNVVKHNGKKLIGVEFNIYKFRTMRVDTPTARSQDLDANKYLTKVGRFLRKTSLDEFPQLVKIVKGDMSLIGPRPSLPTEFELIEGRGKTGALNVIPGVTGLAQVNGRDDIK